MRRREMLVGSSALGLAACHGSSPKVESPEPLPRSVPPAEPAPPSAPVRGASPFLHGVASGDPLTDRVILWTRVTPLAPSEELETRWELAEDPGLRRTVARGSVTATAARDHTVSLDVTGLQPGRAYYYRFEARGHRSPVGRTRTLPEGNVSRLRLAYASCSNYPYGYFNVYAAMARRSDLQAVLHLGDYFYEYENGRYGDGTDMDRVPVPVDHETLSLDDYRARHAIYKTDADLQELHRQHPMIAVWDDHELANDAWWGGAENHQPNEGLWSARRAAAVRAYHEWMPIRALPTDPFGQIYRRFRMGELLDLVMLDTRLIGRDRQADWRVDAGFEKVVADPRRSLLGFPQEAWLARQLEQSKDDGVAWRVLGQQVMMAQMVRRSMGDWVNVDMWDGYAPARKRLLEHLQAREIRDMVVLTGDIHSSWGLEIAADPFGKGYDPTTGRGALAVEFIVPAVSSPSPVRPPDALDRERTMLERHPHLKWIELRSRGYVLLDIDRERTVAEWHLVDSVDERSDVARFGRGLATARGRSHLEDVAQPTADMPDAPEPAPQPGDGAPRTG